MDKEHIESVFICFQLGYILTSSCNFSFLEVFVVGIDEDNNSPSASPAYPESEAMDCPVPDRFLLYLLLSLFSSLLTMAIWLSHFVKYQRSLLAMISSHDLNLYLISLVLSASIVLSKLALNSRGYRCG